MNRDYLERYAWQILGARYIHEPKPLNERIDIEASIARSLEEREALFLQLNRHDPQVKQPALANYWQLSTAEKALIQQQIGRH